METKKIRRVILFFIIMLVLSGITAFPIQWGIGVLVDVINSLPFNSSLFNWIREVEYAVNEVYEIAPFIAYGTDWLAFAHIVIAVAFIGPYQDPVRNIWVIKFGMIACLMIFPLALIAGPIRGIPFIWQLIDCSFGVIGFLVLRYCYQLIATLEKNSTN